MKSAGSLDIVSKQRLVIKAIYDACTEAGIDEAELDELVTKGRDQFTVTNGGHIKPLAQWPSINSFINARGQNAFQPQTATTSAAQQRAKRKAELYDQLCYFANTGNVKAYRELRVEYALL